MAIAYLGHAGGLTVVDGVDGQAPSTARRLDGRRVTAVATAGTELVLAGTFEDGLYRAVDGGGFERVGARTIASDRVTAVATDSNGGWYAGTEPSRLYHSDDGGEHWHEVDSLLEVPSASTWSFPPRPSTHHVRWVEPDPGDPDRLIVGIEAGALLLSEDGGETWVDRPPGSRVDNHTLATHPEAPGRVYAAAGDGYAESTDGGRRWTHPEAGLEHRYVWGLAVDPANADAVVVSAAHGASDAHRRGRAVAYRREGDGPWHRLEAPVVSPAGGCFRAVLAAGPRAIYGASDRGVARSGDGGRTWSALDVDPPGTPPRALRVVAG
ncbi:MAG: WD40/YVTN/BNR-like repeat-containing protein [Halobacteriales archaeon]